MREYEKSQNIQADRITDLQLQTEMLEDRSRRNNLRIRGIPEALEVEDSEGKTKAVFQSILKTTTVDLVIDRVHRALGPKPQNPMRPRDIICRVHRSQQKELILRADWDLGDITFDGA